MDNLTHTLFAATLARTPLRRAGPGTTAVLLLASNAPDIDIIATAGGALKYLEWHRGPSHGPFGIVGLGLVVAGLVWAAQRALGRQPAVGRAPYRTLASVSIVGVLLHVMMDLPTAYGTRPLSPLDWHWYAIDLMPIIDVYLLLVLASGLLFGGRSESVRARSAAIVLLLTVANYGVRGIAHNRALNFASSVFGSRLPEPCDSSRTISPIVSRWPREAPPLPTSASTPPCLVEIAALPTFTSPFGWRLIAQASDAYYISHVNVIASLLDDAAPNADGFRATINVPNQWTAAVFTAARTRVGQRYLGFSRFPAAHSFVDNDGVTVVRWQEMRFTPSAGGPPRREDFFTATVRIDDGGRIVGQQLGQ